MFTRYNSVDEAAKQALQLMDGYMEARMRGSTAILLQAQKKGAGNIIQPLDLIGSPSGTRTYNLVVNSLSARELPRWGNYNIN
jgi:hypothetical protein